MLETLLRAAAAARGRCSLRWSIAFIIAVESQAVQAGGGRFEVELHRLPVVAVKGDGFDDFNGSTTGRDGQVQIGNTLLIFLLCAPRPALPIRRYGRVGGNCTAAVSAARGRRTKTHKYH
jgi:hypothetical protein